MQTIGDRLEEARKKKGVSIREAAEGTKVRGEYLQKFESNQFDLGLSDIYVRGFLRCYAVFLKLPADRILSDYAALGHGDTRPRQPSREVYGRMDVSVASADSPRGEESSLQEQPAAAESSRQAPHVPRIHSSKPLRPGINPALVFKGGIVVVAILILILIFWAVKAFMGGGAPAEPSRSQAVTASAAMQKVPDATVAIVALDSVRIKVARQSDGTVLFQGSLAPGERHEFPNVPLFLTASALESVAIEYKGRQIPTRQKGHDRVKFDFSND